MGIASLNPSYRAIVALLAEAELAARTTRFARQRDIHYASTKMLLDWHE
jgi:hypothetical protein